VAIGDTAENIAQRMAVPDFKLERFRILNGLGPDQSLVVGRLVKLVLE
jgi:predicted Zn-dependent protease